MTGSGPASILYFTLAGEAIPQENGFPGRGSNETDFETL